MVNKNLFLLLYFLFCVIFGPIISYAQKDVTYASISLLSFYKDGTYIEKPISSLGVEGYPHRSILSYGTYIITKNGFYLTASSKLNPDSIKANTIETWIVEYDSVIIEITSPSEEICDSMIERSQYYSIRYVCDNDSISKKYETILNEQTEKLLKNRIVVYKPNEVRIKEIIIEIIPGLLPFPYTSCGRVDYHYFLKNKQSNYFYIDFYDIDYYYFAYYRYNAEFAKKINRNKLQFRGRTYLKSEIYKRRINSSILQQIEYWRGISRLKKSYGL